MRLRFGGALERELVLASGSVVRRRLLTRAGLTFRVDPADIDESPLDDEGPFERARRLAREKALAVSARWPGAIVLGSDQVGVVVTDVPDESNLELSKCWDEEAAIAQLLSMAGRSHTFASAATLVIDGAVKAVLEERATVTFRAFDEDAARVYVSLGEWKGSAGSYHLEGRGVRLVERVDGPDNAVYGLPLLSILRTLDDM